MSLTRAKVFFIQSEGSINIRFIDEGARPGYYPVNLLGGGNFTMRSRVFPKQVPIGSAEVAFPASPGDVIQLFDPQTQSYKDPYEYFSGYGWFSLNPDDPGPGGPIIPPGIGFWIQKSGSAVTWNEPAYSPWD